MLNIKPLFVCIATINEQVACIFCTTIGFDDYWCHLHQQSRRRLVGMPSECCCVVTCRRMIHSSHSQQAKLVWLQIRDPKCLRGHLASPLPLAQVSSKMLLRNKLLASSKAAHHKVTAQCDMPISCLKHHCRIFCCGCTGFETVRQSVQYRLVSLCMW